MQRVTIISPYKGNIRRNVRIARAMCNRAIRDGHAPFAPHLLYPQFLDDTDQIDRRLGMDAGMLYLQSSDLVWVLKGVVTTGMQKELEKAKQLGIKITVIHRSYLEGYITEPTLMERLVTFWRGLKR